MPAVTRVGGRGDGAAVDDGPLCRRRADAAAPSSRGRDLGGRGPQRRVLRQADGGRAQTSLSWLADTLLSQDRAARIKFCRPTGDAQVRDDSSIASRRAKQNDATAQPCPARPSRACLASRTNRVPVVTRIGGRGDGAAVDDGPGCRRRADAAALSSRGRDLGGRGPQRRVLRQADGGRAQTSLSWLADTLLSQDRAAPIRFCRPTGGRSLARGWTGAALPRCSPTGSARFGVLSEQVYAEAPRGSQRMPGDRAGSCGGPLRRWRGRAGRTRRASARSCPRGTGGSRPTRTTAPPRRRRARRSPRPPPRRARPPTRG